MPKFFHLSTGTLYSIENREEADVLFAQKKIKGAIEVNELAPNEVALNELLPEPVLRRQIAVSPSLFFCTSNDTLITGSYDLNSITNNDLVKVNAEVSDVFYISSKL